MIAFRLLDSYADLGYLPGFFDAADPRPARQQIDQNYGHGGGWHPMKGWAMNPDSKVLSYSGDPDLAPLAVGKLRDEVLILYPYAWLAIVQPDGSFEVSRVD